MDRKLSFVGLIFLLLLSFCGGYYISTQSEAIYIKETDTITAVDTFFSVPRETIIYKDTGSTKILTYVDTVRIVDSSFVYVDSLINDSIQLYIKDTVFRSQIVGRSIIYNFDRVYSTNIVEQKKRFFLSAGISYNDGITPMVGINNFSIGYNLKNKRPTFAYIVTIFKK